MAAQELDWDSLQKNKPKAKLAGPKKPQRSPQGKKSQNPEVEIQKAGKVAKN
jgi:hypothetical protein